MTTALTPRFTADARIVSIGSIAARRGAGSYGAAKAAVEAWTADVAATVAFLASPEAGHITGQVIHVNGGAYLGR
jgi:3-oxoacyl-[acyl-carrier protein] reductase